MKNADIIIAGAGASGLMAALTAAEYSPDGTEIVLLEHKASVGKKLLATGNGRCNFTNEIINDMSYRGCNPGFAYNIIEQYNRDWLISVFEDIGIIHTNINGYYYPHSMQAATVVDCLYSRIESSGVHIICNTDVNKICRGNDGYKLVTSDGNYTCSKVIVATGGRSYSRLGSDGSGYHIAGELGHNITEIYPSLTGLVAEGINFGVCKGVRSKGVINLYIDKEKTVSSRGEIQYTEYGISGIPVFEISRYASEALAHNGEVYAIIDMIPDYSLQELINIITNIAEKNYYKTTVELLNAFIPLKLAHALEDKMSDGCNINTGNIRIQSLRRSDYIELCEMIKNIRITIKGDTGFDKAQVTAGGVDTTEVNQKTMESLICPGLYMAGELLDIDGNCGGYNLHFAFATGAIAGMSAALTI